MNNQEVQYSIVVPLFNEELVINETYNRLKKVMDSTAELYEIVMVDDGSKDRTLEIVKTLSEVDRNVKIISFSRNFGHQMAITAGMEYTIGSAVVVIDGDLQDPPEIILKMIEKWKAGYEVVYGQRIERNGETFFKKSTAAIFYRILKIMTDVEIPVDSGDFRLIDRKVCDALMQLPERNRYVRGMVSWLGFRQTGVEFAREARFAGETKYPLKKMIKFAANAMTSFSYKPLRISTYVGSFISLLCFIYLFYVICEKLFAAQFTTPGWASLAAISLFFNGIILVMLGIMGEYIGRIYDEAQGRPLYVISKKIGL